MNTMKRLLGLLLFAFALPALAAPPNWDLSNTYWTAQARDVYYGFLYDGNIRFFTQNTATGAFTGRVQYLPPNNNPLGQYSVSGTVDGDTITFSGVANIPGWATPMWCGRVSSPRTVARCRDRWHTGTGYGRSGWCLTGGRPPEVQLVR
jgi:hypothetical protein